MSFTRRCALWEHRASIAEREMSLAKCGCFQLTSEACYKYSNGAHCAPLHSGTQTDVIVNSDSTWIYFRSHKCSRARLHYWMIIANVFLSYNYHLCYCCCWDEFFRCQPYFLRRDYCAVFCGAQADRLTDRSAARRSYQLHLEAKQNLHGDCSTSSTRAFCSSGTVSPVLLTNKHTALNSWNSKLSLEQGGQKIEGHITDWG